MSGIINLFGASLIPAFLLLTACDKPPVIEQPPERYRQTLGPAAIIIEPTRTVQCLEAGKGLIEGWACTSTVTHVTRIGNPCLYPGELYAEAMCHDVVGHQLNGWPADHPR